MAMDVGQSTANALYQQAVDGTFRMEPGAAKACADSYQTFISSVDQMLRSASTLHKISGFGTFESAKALEDGFSRKGQALTEALIGLQQAAAKMAAAYLLAGNMIDEAEAANKKSIALTAGNIE
ncbi:MAG: hypothetical protein J2P18_03735 [Nocardia sp.]|nr:hypothetical protein [Nocardia sp.]